MKYSLTISDDHYDKLKVHLYPGDGNEAVAVAICGRQKNNESTRLLVHKLICIPYEDCKVREPDLVNWSTEIIIPDLQKAAAKGMAILKIHSHPGGFSAFSEVDNRSDKELFESVFGWMDDEEPHASAIMLPDGKIFGRIFNADLTSYPLDLINVVGDDLIFWNNKVTSDSSEFNLRTKQAFGEGTVSILKGLKICIVGCSGTGSPVIEQLVRLGIGQLVLIDPDKIEKKNLNRITNSTMTDAINGLYKVDSIKNSIDEIGLGTSVKAIKSNVYDGGNVINEIASCDFIFGCVDSVDGRHLLNLISCFYLVPYIDVGIKLSSDGMGGIDQIMGSVHYLKPGGSSLRTRGVYNEEDLRAASLLRVDLKEYEKQKKSGYIVDIDVESPAVVSVNTQVASMAVNEFLARIHSYRYDANSNFAINRISFTDAYYQNELDGDPDPYLLKFVGRGNLRPLLNMSELDSTNHID